MWRIASALHAAYLAGIMSYRLIELKRVGGSWKELGLVIYLVYGAALAQLSNAIWFGAGWLYLASLILIMVMAFGIFPRLLAELQSPAQSERSSP